VFARVRSEIWAHEASMTEHKRRYMEQWRSENRDRIGIVGNMKILIACEFSGIVRDAFNARGHEATSCDLLPCERPGAHIQGDVRGLLNHGWDLLIAHPPCTHLAVSGARWFSERPIEQEAAIGFFLRLANAPIKRIAVENPIGIISSWWRKPDQIIQPWMFGHGETKATCLWLKNLPQLTPTNIVDGRVARVHYASPGPDRWKERSRTLLGIARAMAEQWGSDDELDGFIPCPRCGRDPESAQCDCKPQEDFAG
jgi:hypothetical protein